MQIQILFRRLLYLLRLPVFLWHNEWRLDGYVLGNSDGRGQYSNHNDGMEVSAAMSPKKIIIQDLLNLAAAIESGMCTNIIVAACGPDDMTFAFSGGEADGRQRVIELAEAALADTRANVTPITNILKNTNFEKTQTEH